MVELTMPSYYFFLFFFHRTPFFLPIFSFKIDFRLVKVIQKI